MSCVITLLAHPDKEKLSPARVREIAAALAQAGIPVEREDWLKEGIACDLFTTHDPRSTIHDLLHGMSVDAIVQPAPKPHYKLLISDMDSTMITCECIDELADFVGKKAEVSAITERAMNGELDFANALKERVALLAGLPESVLQQCYDERVRMMQGAKELLAAHKAKGGYSVLVSGGFTFFTSRVARELGFDEDHANALEILPAPAQSNILPPLTGGVRGGRQYKAAPTPPSPASGGGILSGHVKLPILDKSAKLDSLYTICRKIGIAPDNALAIGDGANDLPMLLAAGLGVAYRAKPSVRAQAKAQLNHCDLSALAFIL